MASNAPVTYSNLHHLSAEGGDKGRLYNIARASGQTWRIATSDDWGETWTYRGILTLPPEGGRAYSNGYPKFCDNAVDRIDFILTEARTIHPGVSTAGACRRGVPHRVDDGSGSRGRSPGACAVHLPRGRGEHSKERDDQRPRRRRPSPVLRTAELSNMGHGLYYHEEDYTGLGAIDMADPQVIFISTPFDPHDGKPLSRRELFQGKTDDGGKTWNWTAITESSDADNVRPRVVPLNRGRRLLLWLRGEYHSMWAYQLKVVGRIID